MDIAVVGAGAAGIAAAVAAARAGCRTLLLDRRAGAGGTGGYSGLTTLCGLYDEEGSFLNQGFAHEFSLSLTESAPVQMGRLWVLPYRPARFREVAADLLASAGALQTRWNTVLGEVQVEGDRVVSVNGTQVGAVIDCSGSAEVARAVAADCLMTDETTQASAIILGVHGVARDWATPATVAEVLLPLARAGFPPLSFQPSAEPGAVTLKFTGTPSQVPALIEFLQTKVRGFENCQVPQTELTVAARAGRMVVGQYVLTGEDVLGGRKFADAIARCAWPVEQWGADGRGRFAYLGRGSYYEIPARSLRSATKRNLWMGGKTISADTQAIASARVMGCCLATGAAAGQLAAARLGSSEAV
jgi:FAD-dependent oxidoreductase family protein